MKSVFCAKFLHLRKIVLTEFRFRLILVPETGEQRRSDPSGVERPFLLPTTNDFVKEPEAGIT